VSPFKNHEIPRLEGAGQSGRQTGSGNGSLFLVETLTIVWDPNPCRGRHSV
jgi:hypothetical protein